MVAINCFFVINFTLKYTDKSEAYKKNNKAEKGRAKQSSYRQLI